MKTLKVFEIEEIPYAIKDIFMYLINRDEDQSNKDYVEFTVEHSYNESIEKWLFLFNNYFISQGAVAGETVLIKL
jgi:hypothetical protein